MLWLARMGPVKWKGISTHAKLVESGARRKGKGTKQVLSFSLFSSFSFERITYTVKVIDCEGSL